MSAIMPDIYEKLRAEMELPDEMVPLPWVPFDEYVIATVEQ